MKKTLMACVVVALSMVLLLGTSQAASISFKGLPATVGPGESITFEVWLEGLDVSLVDINTFGLMIGASAGITWDIAWITSETKANPDYVFYENSGMFDATPKDGDLYITDAYELLPAPATVPVKLASLKADQSFPVCTIIDFYTLNEGWSYLIDSEVQLDILFPIDASVHVVPIPGTVLLLGSGLIGLIGLRRRIKRA